MAAIALPRGHSIDQRPLLGSLALSTESWMVSFGNRLDLVYNFFFSRIESINLTGFGMASSAITLITHPVLAFNGYKEWKTSQKVKDVQGAAMGQLKTARYITSVAATALSLPIRLIKMASIGPSSGVGILALSSLSHLATSLRLSSYVIRLKSMCMQINEQREFLNRLESVIDDPQKKGLELLQDALRITDQDCAKITSDIHNTYGHLSHENRKRKFTNKVQKLEAKKERVLTRILGSGCVEMIRKGAEDCSTEIIDKTRGECQSNMIKLAIKIGAVSLLVLGVIIVFMPVNTLLIAAIFTIIGGLLLLGIDAYEYLTKAPGGSKMGQYDDLLFASSSVLGCLGAAFGIFNAVSIGALGICISLGLIWLFLNLTAAYKARGLRIDS